MSVDRVDCGECPHTDGCTRRCFKAQRAEREAAEAAASGLITVPQVFRLLGLTPSDSVSMGVGQDVQRKWTDEYGELPHKENRGKTKGGGSHCFALYPLTWRPKIEACIRARADFERRQLDIFSGDPPAPATGADSPDKGDCNAGSP